MRMPKFKLKELLDGVEAVAIAGHLRPDGDCIGSCMGLSGYIRDVYPECQVDVYLEEIPDRFYGLRGIGEVRHTLAEDADYELFFCLDCGSPDRLGFAENLGNQAKKTVCIDHHISNETTTDYLYVVPEASSTAELVYNLMEPELVTKDTAEALYLGIVHDTGVFQYSSCGPTTLRVAANLLEKGVDAAALIEETFYEKTYAQQQALAYCLLNSKLEAEGSVITAFLSADKMKELQVKPSDLNGIVAQMRQTKGVETSIFLYELEPGTWKASLRSGKRVNVSVIAKTFGGGGHIKAAGCTLHGTAQEALHQLLVPVKEQLKES